MRFIRLLGVVVIFYSMSYLLHALMQLYSSLLHPGRTELFKYIAINLPIGIVTFISGIGLLLAKEWARTAWLVTGIVLLLLHVVLLRLFYAAGVDLSQQGMNLLMIVFLVLISWMNLTKPSIKKHFR